MSCLYILNNLFGRNRVLEEIETVFKNIIHRERGSALLHRVVHENTIWKLMIVVCLLL